MTRFLSLKATLTALVLSIALLAAPVHVSAANTTRFKNNVAITGTLAVTGAITNTSSVFTSPVIKTSIILNSTTASPSIAWSDPAAANVLTIPDTSGNDTFAFIAASQTFTNKTLTTPLLKGAGAGKATLQYANSATDRTITFPDPGGADSVDYLGAAQTITGVKTMSGANVIKVANTGLTLLDTAADNATTLKQNSNEAADRVLSIPALGADDTLMTLGTAQAVTGIKTMSGANVIKVANTGLTLLDTSADNVTTLKQNSNEAADRVLNIPALGGDDTLATLGAAQSVTGAKTFADSKCINTEGSGTATFNPQGVLNLQVTQVSTAADTTETTGHTYSLPANTLSANNRAVRVRAWGTTAANANNKTVQLYFGASAYTTGAVAANAKDWCLEMLVVRTASNAQTVLISGHFNGSLVTASSRTTLTQTDSNAITIKTTMTNGSASASDITCNGFEVTALP